MRKNRDNGMESQGTLLSRLAGEEYCYLTSTGRASGRPHEIEIWFVLQGPTLYLLSGGGGSSDWVKNMRVQPSVSVRIGKQVFDATARFEMERPEEQRARRLLAAKYQGWREGRRLSDWARTALPVAVDLLLKEDPPDG
jgi:deazaflavin-dependent oxidoreductase (nitroreductase family)